MRKLRSPWTVLALVPVFFLAGFAIVSATAGGSKGTAALPPASTSVPQQAATTVEASTEEATTEAEAPTEPATTAEQAPPTTTAPAPPPPPPPTTTEPPTTGAPPPGPKPGVIEVDYGEWKNAIRITKTKIVQGIATATVQGEFRYLGGGKCKPKSIELRALFYDKERVPVGQGFWDTAWTTGEDEAVPKSPLAMEVYGMVRHETTSATLRVYKATCV